MVRVGGLKNIVEQHEYGRHGRRLHEVEQFQDDEELLEQVRFPQKSSHRNEDLIGISATIYNTYRSELTNLSVTSSTSISLRNRLQETGKEL